jgi:hypothetical protein
LLSKIVAALIAFGPWGVFLLGFIDSLGIPLPATMDALLVLVAVKAPHRAYFTALMAVLGAAAASPCSWPRATAAGYSSRAIRHRANGSASSGGSTATAC